MNGFERWVKNPDQTRSRLSTIASIIAMWARGHCDKPQNGDDAWSLGCRAYARTRDAIKKAAGTYDWLKILPETTWLGFSFAIGASPCRFYRGDPEEPPYHYQSKSYGEIHQIQLCLDLDQGFPPLTACSVSQSRLTEAVRF